MNKSLLCSNCAQALEGNWESRESLSLAMGEVIQRGGSYERRVPARVGTLRSDLVLPLGQAIVTALVGTILGVILGGWRLGVAAGGVMFAITWLLLLWDHRRAMWVVEYITGQDLDRDGAIGKPEPQQVRVELVEDHRGGGRLRFLDLPITEAKLRDVARAVLGEGANFSRRGLGEVMSQADYERLARAMIKAGLLVDLPGNNRELSAAGRALLRRVSEGQMSRRRDKQGA